MQTQALEIEGYASLFDIQDQGGDVVRAGAFARSLKHRQSPSVRMLFQHDVTDPIGVWDEIREDSRGLFLRGRILSSSPRGKAAASLVSNGAVDGLSIGFRTIRSRSHRTEGLRELLELDLWEVSIVTFPMLPMARLRVVEPLQGAA